MRCPLYWIECDAQRCVGAFGVRERDLRRARLVEWASLRGCSVANTCDDIPVNARYTHVHIPSNTQHMDDYVLVQCLPKCRGCVAVPLASTVGDHIPGNLRLELSAGQCVLRVLQKAKPVGWALNDPEVYFERLSSGLQLPSPP